MRIVFFILCEKPFSPYVGRQPRPDILVINVKFNKRTTKSTEYHVDTQANRNDLKGLNKYVGE